MEAPDAPCSPSPRGEPDAFGFSLRLSSSARAARAACEALAARREGKPAWRAFAATGALPGSGATLKRLFRKGVPAELRAAAWARVSGAEELRRRGGEESFAELLARQPSAGDAAAERQIDLDLQRTFPEHPWLRGPEAQASLRRVLVALARATPEQGYCQSQNYGAAFALLVYRSDEEGAFWLLRCALAQRCVAGTYATDLRGLQLELGCLRRLLAVKSPRVGAALVRLGGDPSFFATDWLLCLFTCTLPAETVARVWDAWLCEGPKVLLRMALALVLRCEASLVRADSVLDFVEALRCEARTAHDRDALLNTAFHGIGSLPTATLQRFRAQAAQELDAQIAETERRREQRLHS